MPSPWRSAKRTPWDWRYIEEQLRPLAEVKQEAEIFQTLARLRELD
jgi:hypothetical protein